MRCFCSTNDYIFVVNLLWDDDDDDGRQARDDDDDGDGCCCVIVMNMIEDDFSREGTRLYYGMV